MILFNKSHKNLKVSQSEWKSTQSVFTVIWVIRRQILFAAKKTCLAPLSFFIGMFLFTCQKNCQNDNNQRKWRGDQWEGFSVNPSPRITFLSGEVWKKSLLEILPPSTTHRKNIASFKSIFLSDSIADFQHFDTKFLNLFFFMKWSMTHFNSFFSWNLFRVRFQVYKIFNGKSRWRYTFKDS
jgi:hypothetical protein